MPRAIKPKKLPIFEVNLKYKVYSRTRVFWDFHNDIPPLETIARPLSPDWKKRVEEEIEIFNIWRKFNESLPLRNLEPVDNRRFSIEININDVFNEELGWRKVYILIPLNYPFRMPTLGDPSSDYWFIKLLRKWTGNRPFCIPRVIYLWWTKLKGKAGIAHYMHIFLVFVTIAGRKSTQLDYDQFTLDI